MTEKLKEMLKEWNDPWDSRTQATAAAPELHDETETRHASAGRLE